MEHASATLADYNLATDPSADLELLNQLAESDHPYVLTVIASHANTDLALLERITAKTVHVAIFW